MFVRRQRGLADPFVDLRLFGDRAFSVAAVTLALGIFVLWGSNYAIAQYLQLVHGMSPLEAGLWTAPSAVGVIVGSTLAPRVARRVRPSLVIGVGLGVSAVGYAVLAQTGGLPVLITGAVVVSAGLGPMMALATDMVVGSAPAERAGAAAAISSTAPQLGGALGIALLGSLITAVYRVELSSATVPTGARDNLGAAVALAHGLSGRTAADLLSTARAAFVDGFHVAVYVSAVLMALIALVVVALLRRR